MPGTRRPSRMDRQSTTRCASTTHESYRLNDSPLNDRVVSGRRSTDGDQRCEDGISLTISFNAHTHPFPV